MPKRIAIVVAAMMLASTGLARASAPNDPWWPQQWGTKQIRADVAWATSSGAGVKVAVIDTGVDLAHEDLKANLLGGFDEVDGDANPQDVTGHGTMVAGIIAAVRNNALGVAGVAPGAKVIPIRVFNAAGQIPSDAAVDQAVMDAVDAGASVINMSFGAKDLVCVVDRCAGPAGPLALIPGLDDSIAYAFAHGVLVVAATGNDGTSLCDYPGFSPFALCVGSTDRNDALVTSSNHGVRTDVVAPGVEIDSTWWDAANPSQHSMYKSGDGTSFAAPMVSGIAALLMSMGASNVQVARVIECTATDLGAKGYDTTFGWGRVDAAAAVAKFADMKASGTPLC